MDRPDDLLGFAIELAREAGELLVARFHDRDRLLDRLKSPRNLVTQADLEAERLIRSRIAARHPEHEIIGEELERRAGSGVVWHIDPLDGTTNYAYGIPHWCVSIGACDAAGGLAGVILDPLRGELFAAGRGGGATLNGAPIRSAEKSDPEEALCATGFAMMRGNEPDHDCIETFRRIIIRAQGIRRLGSAALDLAYVANGRFDLFFEEGLASWDLAAGALIVAEAGGLVRDYRNEEGFLENGSIVCGHKPLVDWFLREIRGRAA
jgi:myo-inositol-1(or 4)-monophosphatase